MPSLFVIQGRDQGARFELTDPVVNIGREVTNTIQLHDTEISREHAELKREGDTYRFRDLGSSNGSYVNRKSVRDHRLVSGDQVQLGRTLMLYTAQSPEHSGHYSGGGEDPPQIVALGGDAEGSRILHALRQSGSSDFLQIPTGDEVSPWLDRARSNLQIMYRTALAVSQTLDIEQLLTRIMDMIFEWVNADRGCILLKDEHTGKLALKVRRHRQGAQTADRISISQTILDYVVQKNEGVLTSNARDDDRWDPAHSIVKLGVREAICVPMQGRYEVVGVIYIDTTLSAQQVLREGGATKFSQEHLKLMIAIAHQAALAVEDTSYYQGMVQAERLAAIGQTIASLSHHIKNILQGVQGGSYLIETAMQQQAEALASGEWDPQAAEKTLTTLRKGWNIVDRNQERISTLVMDMLTFSKEREPEPEEARLNEVVADVVELMQSRAAEREVTLYYTPDEKMPVSWFDSEAIHRAVLNVVTNAIDACDGCTQREVRITTGLTENGKALVVEVQDTGVGISEEDREKIFTVFVSKKGGRGTGLGLSVSQKIMQEHGGNISAESKPGSGSLFRLQLPVRTAEEVAASSVSEKGREEMEEEMEIAPSDVVKLPPDDSEALAAERTGDTSAASDTSAGG